MSYKIIKRDPDYNRMVVGTRETERQAIIYSNDLNRKRGKQEKKHKIWYDYEKIP